MQIEHGYQIAISDLEIFENLKLGKIIVKHFVFHIFDDFRILKKRIICIRTLTDECVQNFKSLP